MDRRSIMKAAAAAQAAAGLSGPINTGAGASQNSGPALENLEQMALSRDERTASAALRKLQALRDAPEADASAYEEPPETPPLDQMSPEERRARAADITKDPFVDSGYE